MHLELDSERYLVALGIDLLLDGKLSSVGDDDVPEAASSSVVNIGRRIVTTRHKKTHSTGLSPRPFLAFSIVWTMSIPSRTSPNTT